MGELSLVWLRRDLRLHDHAALFHALQSPGLVQPVFIFDREILARFPDPQDRRLSFIAGALCGIDAQLKKRGGGLLVLHGDARDVMPKLSGVLGAVRIVAAEDYEPGAMARDAAVEKHTSLSLVKDQLIFSPKEIVKSDGTPYKVYTPYAKSWRAQLTPASTAPYEISDAGRYGDINTLRAKAAQAGLRVLDPADGVRGLLADIGYRETYLPLWPVPCAGERLDAFIAAKVAAYAEKRNMVADEGTSRLSPYLRFGLVSVRECFRVIPSPLEGEGRVGGGSSSSPLDGPLSQPSPSRGEGYNKWLSELIWREFYAMILYHFPESATMEWNPAYRGTLEWRRDEGVLQAWKDGLTGYPLVDAAMRELRTTGWMHNRARMVVASFLTKDLLLDWRLGEEHFAQLLMDYDMASNVGGWQWAASTGTDAQPWFRIFNPTLQSEKFDPDGKYIRRYVAELKDVPTEQIHAPEGLFKPADYPAPIVDHAHMRELALGMFKRAANR